MQNRKYIKSNDSTWINIEKNALINSFTLSKDRDGFFKLFLTLPKHPSIQYFIQSFSPSLSSAIECNGFTNNLELKSKNLDLFRELISKMDILDPLDIKTKRELINYLNITLPGVINEIDIFDMLVQGKWDDALKLAKESDQEDILWKLGQKSESFFSDNFANAIACYQEIPADNSFYENANKRIFELLMQHDSSNDSDEEKRKLLENKFRYALLISEKDEKQVPVAQLFHELCGYKDLQPDISPLKGDPDTLIAIARKMNALLSESPAAKKIKSTAPSGPKLFK
jgi:hypothetical protein